MSDSQPRVHLHQLRNQAKDLHRSSQDAEILARIRHHHPRFANATQQVIDAEFSLQEAQHLIAREHGYASWPKLVAAVGDVQEGDREGRFTKYELRGVERLHMSLAESLQQRLRRAGQEDAEVRVQFTDQVTWAEFQGSRPPAGWSYSYLARPLDGGAIFDLPLATAQTIDPEIAAFLAEVVAGTRDIDTMTDVFGVGAHARFAGPVFEDIEAAWVPAMVLEMYDVEIEIDPQHPRRRIAEPHDVVAYAHLVMANGEVALRTCYPYATLEPKLEALDKVGRQRD